MNTALIIIGLAMFIFIVVFTLKRSKEKRKIQQEEHEKIKEYGERINEETRNKNMNTKEDLINYCLDKNRICPMPPKWAKIGEIIKIKPGHPCTPLILNGWVSSSDQDKKDRLAKQIEYASENVETFEKLKMFILNLKDDDWKYR